MGKGSQVRGFSTRYEDHVGMLMKFAQTGLMMARERGVDMEFDDVYQEMCETYCKARDGYDPMHGITFTAYLGRACATNFNRKLGYAKRHVMHHVDVDRFVVDNDEFLIDNLAHETLVPSHEGSIVNSNLIERGFERLSRDAKRVFIELMRHETSPSAEDGHRSVTMIALDLGMSRHQAKQIQQEFKRTFA